MLYVAILSGLISLFRGQVTCLHFTLTGIIIILEITCQITYLSKWQIILYVMLVYEKLSPSLRQFCLILTVFPVQRHTPL